MDDTLRLSFPRLTLQSSHAAALSAHFLSHPDQYEGAAAVFFRKIIHSVEGLPISARYLTGC